MKKLQQIACILGVVFLVGLYLLSLISAIFYNDGFEEIFSAAVYSTIVVPIVLYIIIFLSKKTIQTEDDESEEK